MFKLKRHLLFKGAVTIDFNVMEVMEELRSYVIGTDHWQQQQADIQRRLRSKIAIRKRRQDPEIREREREKNLLAMRRRRENPETREKERERNRIAMRLRRQDPEFREKEKLAVKLRRMTNPELREKDKIAHRVRKQNPEFRAFEKQRQRCVTVKRLAQELEYAETADTADSPSFYFSEGNKWPPWRLGQGMDQGRMTQSTSDVGIIPFTNETIKQEEVESSDSVDMMASYQDEEGKLREEQSHEVEMDPSLAVTMMNVVLKDDSNASSADVEELVVEPSLVEFRCISDDERCEGDASSSMIVVPEGHSHHDYVEEERDYESSSGESKRLKYTTKKSRVSGGSSGVANGGMVYRCPHCTLSLTSADYLARHIRRGCRFRDAPIKNAYRCTLCGEGFSNYGELYQHRRRAHAGDPTQSHAHTHAQPVGATAPKLHRPPCKPERFPSEGPSPYSAPDGLRSYPPHPPSSLLNLTPGLLFNNLLVSAAAPSLPVVPSEASPVPVIVTPDITSALAAPPTDAPGTSSRTPNSRSRYPATHQDACGQRTPDLVFSSSAAVNHFEPVVPDVAASSSSVMGANIAVVNAPDIVSCSRPGVVCAPAPVRSVAVAAATGRGDPPDLVAVSTSQQRRAVYRGVREEDGEGPERGPHLRVTSVAPKRKITGAETSRGSSINGVQSSD